MRSLVGAELYLYPRRNGHTPRRERLNTGSVFTKLLLHNQPPDTGTTERATQWLRNHQQNYST